MADDLKFSDGLDLERFWRDDALAHKNNCFNDGTRVALGIRMSDECVFDELGIAVNHPWDPQDPQQQAQWNRQYNDKAEKVVGRRLLSENVRPKDSIFPEVRRIGEVFGGKYIWQNHTEWLEKGVSSYRQLEKLLDRTETMDYRAFMLPASWDAEKRRIYETYGLRPSPLRHLRGPVTLACSILGTEALIYLIVDEPELAQRFSSAITHAVLEMARISDEEAEETPATKPGFYFADDNCCLLTPEMYAIFGYPVLRDVFARYSPGPEHPRFQHSDSDMGHLLPVLGQLDLNGVNFGPNVLVPEIRRHLPRARIDGCIAPFAFSRNEHEALVRQTKRDCQAGMLHGGVNIATAGSINYGSTLASMRLIMATVQQYGRG